MDESVGVRVARADDYDRIVAVVDEWWGRLVGSSLPRLFLDHFWSSSRIVEDGLGLAAFLIAFLSPSQPRLAYVHFVGVRPDHRRSGLARELYEGFAWDSQEWRCIELRAVTAPSNTGSFRFHTDRGFTVSGAVADYNGPGQPMVTFSRPLSPANDRFPPSTDKPCCVRRACQSTDGRVALRGKDAANGFSGLLCELGKSVWFLIQRPADNIEHVQDLQLVDQCPRRCRVEPCAR